MRPSPSIAATLPDDVNVYLVLDDFRRRGRAWRETDEDRTDRETASAAGLMSSYRNGRRRRVASNRAVVVV
jgi:hypothetical protein